MPFDRFEGSDAVLGPEMRSTGEVMGIARDFPTAFAKAQAAAGSPLPTGGTAFITVTDSDKAGRLRGRPDPPRPGLPTSSPPPAPPRRSSRMGVPVTTLNKIGEGSPHVVDWIERGDVDIVINTPTGSGARTDGWEIRRAAVARGIPCLTTLSAGVSAARAIAEARTGGAPPVLSLQELHRETKPRGDARLSRAGLDRRRLTVTGNDEVGAYRVLRVADPDGPPPAAGQFAMLTAAQRWGGGRTSGRTCRGPSRSRAGPTARPTTCSRTSGPGPSASARCAPATSCSVLGPLGQGFRAPERRPPRACSSAAGWASPRWRSGRTSCWPPSAGTRCCSASATAPTPTGATSCAMRARRHRRRVARPPRLRHRRCWTPSSTPTPHATVYACGPPLMLEAVRALCAARDVPAQLALESGMACGFGACFGCVVPTRGGGYVRVCVDGPVLDADLLDEVEAHAGAPG